MFNFSLRDFLSRLIQLEYPLELLKIMATNLGLGMMVVIITIPIITAFILEPYFSSTIVFLWLLSNIILISLRVIISHLITKSINEKQYKKNYLIYYLSVLIAYSSLWGITLYYCYGFVPETISLALVTIVIGMNSGAISTLNSNFHAFLCYVTPMLLPTIISFISGGESLFIMIGGLLLIYYIVISFASFKTYSYLKHNIKLRTELVKAKDDADNANLIKSNLFSKVTKEFKEPINTIISLSEQMSYTLPILSPQINQIRNLSNYLNNILNNIIDYSKIETQSLVINHSTYNLNDLLIDIKSTTRYLIIEYQKNIKLEFDLEQNIPHIIKGDPVRLFQVLINLISNSIKYLPEGILTITISVDTTNDKPLTKEINHSLVKFSVKDNGNGLSTKQELEFKAEKFTHSGAHKNLVKSIADSDDNMLNFKETGVGLGLEISQYLIQLMDSHLHINNSPNNGCEFYFSLNVESLDDELSLYLSQTSNNTTGTVADTDLLRGLNILIVEDNLVNQLLFKEILNEYKINVFIANNGKEALPLLDKHTFHCILMDVQMPILDGYETTKRVRLHPNYKQIPIIAITANALIGDKEKCLKSGMDDYLSKPVDAQHLINVISKWMQSSNNVTNNFAQNNEHRQSYIQEQANEDEYKYLDVKGAEKYFVNQEIYFTTLQLFLKNQKGTIKKIKTAISENELELARRTVHTLKGLSKQIGANDFHLLVVQIEQVLLHQLSDNIQLNKEELNIDLLEDKFNLLIKDVQKYLDVQVSIATEPSNLSSTHENTADENNNLVISSNFMFKEKLEQLNELVNHYDMEAINHLTSILPKLKNDEILSELQIILQYLHQLKFEEAKKLLKEIQVKN